MGEIAYMSLRKARSEAIWAFKAARGPSRRANGAARSKSLRTCEMARYHCEIGRWVIHQRMAINMCVGSGRNPKAYEVGVLPKLLSARRSPVSGAFEIVPERKAVEGHGR